MKPVANKAAGAICIAFPDVCKTPTPAGPIPIPYPNVAKTAQAKQQSKKVKVGGGGVSLKKGSAKKSLGNEAATRSFGAGVISAKTQGEVAALKAQLNSLNVKMQGLPADRPDQWQAVIQDYAVTASALYMTQNQEE